MRNRERIDQINELHVVIEGVNVTAMTNSQRVTLIRTVLIDIAGFTTVAWNKLSAAGKLQSDLAIQQIQIPYLAQSLRTTSGTQGRPRRNDISDTGTTVLKVCSIMLGFASDNLSDEDVKSLITAAQSQSS
jgi:hypothetical protein